MNEEASRKDMEDTRRVSNFQRKIEEARKAGYAEGALNERSLWVKRNNHWKNLLYGSIGIFVLSTYLVSTKVCATEQGVEEEVVKEEQWYKKAWGKAKELVPNNEKLKAELEAVKEQNKILAAEVKAKTLIQDSFSGQIQSNQVHYESIISQLREELGQKSRQLEAETVLREALEREKIKWTHVTDCYIPSEVINGSESREDSEQEY